MLPGSRVVGFGRDASGNVTSIVPPGRPAHGFTYTATDALESYRPPVASSTGLLGTTYGYNLDGALAQVLLPDESAIVPGYDTAGRLASVTTARGTTVVGYDTVGRLQALAAPDSGIQTFGYDGVLPTSETRTGAVAGTVRWGYDNDFRVASVSVNGAAVSYQYDLDSLLTQAGALTVTPRATSGRISGTLSGGDDVAELRRLWRLGTFSASASGVQRYSYTLTPDAAGRISRKIETVLGATRTYGYGYDDAGRLATVHADGVLQAATPTTWPGTGYGAAVAGTDEGTYDDQDRLLSYGAATYTWRPNGDLGRGRSPGRRAGTPTTPTGTSLQAALPGGTIEYLMDGQNRRVGKKVNSAVVEGFLYRGSSGRRRGSTGPGTCTLVSSTGRV